MTCMGKTVLKNSYIPFKPNKSNDGQGNHFLEDSALLWEVKRESSIQKGKGKERNMKWAGQMNKLSKFLIPPTEKTNFRGGKVP